MKKTLPALLACLAFASAPVSAVSLTDLTNGLDTFVSDATASLPFAASTGLDWSDAYIGNLLAVPPHFGVGVVAGATTIPGKAVKPLLSALGGSLDGDLPLPNVAATVRIGGVVLPFDVGLKAGVIPKMDLAGYSVEYTNLGADVRFALFQGEPLLPTISLGGGVSYLDAKLGAKYGDNVSVPNPNNGSASLLITAPEAKLGLSALTFEGKAQISKSLLILTPYLGVSVLSGSATAKANVASSLSLIGGGSYSDFGDLGGVTSAGFGKEKSVATFGAKIYGGAALNILLLHLDVQGMYSVLDGSLGGSVGARFQL